MHEKLFFSTLLLGILTSFYIYKKAYPNNKLTCKNYILNSYLYITLSIIIVSLVILFIDTSNFKDNLLFRSRYQFLLFFVFSMGFLLLTLFTNPENTILKHISWLAFIMLIGIIMYPIVHITRERGIFMSAAITTISIIAVLTLIAFYKPELISLSWGMVLFILLIAGIILNFSLFFMNPKSENFRKFNVYLSYGFIVLFSFFILYDTKRMQIKARNCKTPDYINQSLSLFLDFINLFANISRGQIYR